MAKEKNMVNENTGRTFSIISAVSFTFALIGIGITVVLATVLNVSDRYYLDSNELSAIYALKFEPIDEKIIDVLPEDDKGVQKISLKSKIETFENLLVKQNKRNEGSSTLIRLLRILQPKIDGNDPIAYQYRIGNKFRQFLLDYNAIENSSSIPIDEAFGDASSISKQEALSYGINFGYNSQNVLSHAFIPTRILRNDWVYIEPALSATKERPARVLPYSPPTEGSQYYTLEQDLLTPDKKSVIRDVFTSTYTNSFIDVIGVTLYGSQSPFGVWLWPVAICSIAFLLIGIVGATIRKRQIESKQKAVENQRYQRLAANLDRLSASMPAWEMAQMTLESYFTRNLQQIKQIFWFSIMAMSAGFGLIIFGIMVALKNGEPGSWLISTLPTASGIITEFIAATFLYIYRSTLAQAKEYAAFLERMNAVGMSMQILESIDPQKGDQVAEVAAAKMDIAKTLLRNIGELYDK
jgi:hypothetical protein